MSDATFVSTSSAAAPASAMDYVRLMKPRVMSLVVFTAFVGLVAAPVGMNPVAAACAVLAVAIGSGAAGALNMWFDADIDAKMARTVTRPVPAGVVRADEALSFGLVMSGLSVTLMALAATPLAAVLLAFSIFFYAVVYTMWLKRSTAQNIVIGGAAGAFPPMIGEAAVSGTVSLETFVLFLIIFLWTPPHFWALALVKSSDYARAGIPMMPNVAGPDATRLQILLYTLVLAPCGVAPLFLGFGGWVYAMVSTVGGVAMLALAVQVFRIRTGEPAMRAAQHLFGFSILYLFALFAALLAEHGLGLMQPLGWRG
jgi:protoheme IX farnesyltransferase